MEWFHYLIRYLYSAGAGLPFVRRVAVRLRLAERKVRVTVRRRPIYLLVAAVAVVTYYIFFPESLPQMVRPDHTCYVIRTNDQFLGSAGGDKFTDGPERPCETRSVVAIEWYNLSGIKSSPGQPTKNVVTAGVFLSGATVSPANRLKWFEL
jgi:hypothetical protein